MPRTMRQTHRFYPMPAVGHSTINGVLDVGVTVVAVADDLEIDQDGKPWYVCECEIETFRRYHVDAEEVGQIILTDNGKFWGQVTALSDNEAEINWKVVDCQ